MKRLLIVLSLLAYTIPYLLAQSDYKMAGPYEVVARDGQYRNSTLWADVAHPIMIGLHGNPAIGDSIVGLRYDNIDIIGQNELQVDYQGCLAINCGDGAMTNTEARSVTISTDFLPKGKYEVEIYNDDPSLHTRTKVSSKTMTIKSGKPITLQLQPSGGAALHFKMRNE